MEEISYTDALKYLQQLQPQWGLIMEELRRKRESYFGDLKRNSMTPECNDRADCKAIGGMLAIDDLLVEWDAENPS